ncbi:3'(2'),5'-bisphosphate nucleotidase CysQ [Pasteurellaceae bacterium LIM206]|nr:3'(2'),5'-bisphosphate nucleotidase CysQ [Pasteurellaceae bacterium LIM206]
MQINQQFLQSVLAIAYQAGRHLTEFYAHSVSVHTKTDNTPVTEADLFVSQFLVRQLTALTPDIPVLSEENCTVPLRQRQDWRRYWLIDPLDGTQQFIDRSDQFSVIISLVDRHQPILGVIHAPILQKTYYAVKGQGAFVIEQNRPARRLQPINADISSRIKIAIGSTAPRKILQTLRSPYQAELIQYGSSSLKAGMVAEGLVDCYLRLGNTGEWDTAAAEVILAEIGGRIFNLHFRPLSYNQRESLVNPHFVMVNRDADWEKIFQFNQ